ncbi:hypothetical protein WN943_017223 [Citrus x changshan-huyou]
MALNLRIIFVITILLSLNSSHSLPTPQQQPPPPPSVSLSTACNGVFLSYTHTTGYPIPPTNPANQAYRFESTVTILNNGLNELKSWRVFDARFWLSSFYDQGLCSINFTMTRISPRKASSPEVPAHTDRSEYAGCFPGANPLTLKSDMKVRRTLATNLMAVSLPLSPGLPQFTPVVLPTLGCGCPIIFMMGEWRWTSCLDSRIGRHVSPTAVDRVSSPQTLAGGTPARRILPPNICSSRLVSPKYFPQTPAAKENAQGVEPIVIEEESSPSHAIPADVGEASTPPDATESARLRLIEQVLAWHMVSPHALENSSMLEILLAFADFFDAWGFCSPSRGRADPGMLGFCLAIKQALRLGEPFYALMTSSMLEDSVRLHVVEQILAYLASVSP